MSAQPHTLPHFRRMRAPDLDLIAAQEASAYEFPWTRGNFNDALDAGYDCLADAGGFASYRPLYRAVRRRRSAPAQLDGRAEWQRRGYGRILLQQMINEAKPHKSELMLLEVRPSNAPRCRCTRRSASIRSACAAITIRCAAVATRTLWGPSLAVVDPLGGNGEARAPLPLGDAALAELDLLPVWRWRGVDHSKTPRTARSKRARIGCERRFPQQRIRDGLDAAQSVCQRLHRCVLHERRTQSVFGVGDEQANWLFVGEGPGADEDERRTVCRSSRQAARQHAERHRVKARHGCLYRKYR